ncbi:MAG: DNA alkylation repair protein [Bacillota bacterium]|nr:DNA alkylation repair protein [Bacillota bacterium]
MAHIFADRYGLDYANQLADTILSAYPGFNREGFVTTMRSCLGAEAMLRRQDLYVDALEKYLSSDYEENLDLFTKIWGEELKQETGMFSEGWWLWPFGRYVERHGLKNPEASYRFIHGFTKRQTGEFMIRPLLNKNTRRTMVVLREFSLDESVHVRRLASEGMRISLPWAKKTTAALTEPAFYQDILTRLKEDPSRFVMKSVGNNLNDLYKFDGALAESLVKKWEKEGLSDTAKWVVRHGQRSERKKTNPAKRP